MRRVRPLFMSLAVVAMLAAGCTDDPKPKEPTGGPSQSAEPSVDAPVYPENAKAETAEGASYFVDFYLALLTHATQTGETAPLAAASDPSCSGCATYVEHFDKRADAGGSVEGGAWTAGDIRVSPYGADTALEAQITIAASTVKDDARAEPQEYAEGQEVVTFVANFADGKWRMMQFVPGELP